MDAFRYKVGSCNPVNYIHHREYNDSPSTVKKLIRMKMCSSKSLFSKNLLAHFGCVNAIEFSSGGELLASGGDDRRVLLWNFEESLHGVGHPVPMRAQHISNIFCLGFDSKTTKIFSAGNDDQVIVHDIKTYVFALGRVSVIGVTKKWYGSDTTKYVTGTRKCCSSD